MSWLVRIFIRIAVIALVIFVAIQPYNWFCQITDSCRPFYFSYYQMKKPGKVPMEVKLEVTNYNPKLVFMPLESSVTVVSNKKIIVTYRAQNLSKKTIRLHPLLIVEPDYFKKNLIRHDCLCEHSYKIKPLQEIKMDMEFEIDDNIEAEPRFKLREPLIIRYKISS